MKQQNLIILISIFLPTLMIGQQLKSNLFLRTPQVVNYNLSQKEISYSQVISIGMGLSYKDKFIELATFIT